MTTKHISDTDIQQYILDKENCEINIIDHIKICKDCKTKAEQYQQLFTKINEQTKPAFAFNLPELVLFQITKPKTKFSSSIFFIYLLAFAGVSLIVILFYFVLEYLLKMFTDVSPLFMYLIIIISTIILAFQGIDVYRQYRKKMNILNLI